MKKIAILIALVLVLAVAVVLWAQREPDNLQPSSGFYGTITYHGCNCNQNDNVCIRPDGDPNCYNYRIQRCGGNPGYSTMGQTPEKLQQGWYYLSVEVPTVNGCTQSPEVHVWHSGMVDQEVNLSTY